MFSRRVEGIPVKKEKEKQNYFGGKEVAFKEI